MGGRSEARSGRVAELPARAAALPLAAIRAVQGPARSGRLREGQAQQGRLLRWDSATRGIARPSCLELFCPSPAPAEADRARVAVEAGGFFRKGLPRRRGCALVALYSSRRQAAALVASVRRPCTDGDLHKAQMGDENLKGAPGLR